MSMLKITFLLSMSLCMMTFALNAQSDFIKVATWNMQWLNKEAATGMVPRDQQDYQRLRLYAKLLDADVIALQEVDGPEAARRLLSNKDYQFVFSTRRHTQRVGFAIKRQHYVVQQLRLSEFALNSNRLRQAVLVTIDFGKQQIDFLAVHLKSGCFTDELSVSDKRSCQLLLRQLQVLIDFIMKQNNRPLVVLGDFNRVFGADDMVWQQLRDHGMTYDASQGQQSRCWQARYPNYIDHIVLGTQLQKQVVPNSFEQLVYLQTDQLFYHLSDHCPISILLELNK